MTAADWIEFVVVYVIVPFAFGMSIGWFFGRD